jgi:hypothetical protein
MPTPTYTALANITLGSTASSVTFGSIPATYRDLVLVAETIAGTNQSNLVRYNSDSGSNYTTLVMRGYGASITESLSTTDNVLYITYSGIGSGQKCLTTLSVMDYSATDKHKAALHRSNYTGTATTFVEAMATRWANTAAISSIQFFASTGSFAIGSTFSLYGIVA